MKQRDRLHRTRQVNRACSTNTCGKLETDELARGALHRRMGNQALQRLMRTGEAFSPLRVSQLGDASEREADRVAERVMRMPDPGVARPCPACHDGSAPCPACRQGEGRRLRASEAAAPPRAPGGHTVGERGGGPLDRETRAFFEPRLGVDLSHVRVHRDEDAAASARGVDARAYTVGRHIVFAGGEYAPQTTAGRRLLAHELAHVVQQGSEARGSEPDSSTIHRTPAAAAGAAAAEVTIGTVLAWCLSGAAVSVLIDQAIQMIGWAFRGAVRQNWCKTIISALFGCVFGMVGGAIRTMIFSTVARFTIAEIVQWVYQRLVGAGAAWLAGKWGVTMAKLGCDRDESRM